MDRVQLPLFPLNTVLFPGGPLELRIFEARYVDMVRRCLKEGSPFGVVLILAGAEAGAVTEVADIGTSARLVDFDTLPDGLLGVTTVGERRFRVQRRWQQPDGLHLGEVEYLPRHAVSGVEDAQSSICRRIAPAACRRRWPTSASCCGSCYPSSVARTQASRAVMTMPAGSATAGRRSCR